ncbi:hypothetical protein PCCS19_17900 [Paenibacillus sp. CCS19]|uniref:hypothetical protein n=1 Tax=Paenibacillus sp. CCS19 TaxID=3158387 RepID=UPI002562DD1D|nr:hypothetical protein [Paenibacillus cellulosilyticus]GMK38736.1 hypothetical protein PCCS19_17900 [Paenibacillus cellulosilyticus]
MTMTIQQRYGREIWRHILHSAVEHNQLVTNPDDLSPDTPTANLFPPETDIIRFKAFMVDVYKYVNKLTSSKYEMTFSMDSIYVNFGTFKDIWIHFIHRLEMDERYPVEAKQPDAATMGVVVPFRRK